MTHLAVPYVEDARIQWTGCCCSACPSVIHRKAREQCALLRFNVCGGCATHSPERVRQIRSK